MKSTAVLNEIAERFSDEKKEHTSKKKYMKRGRLNEIIKEVEKSII